MFPSIERTDMGVRVGSLKPGDRFMSPADYEYLVVSGGGVFDEVSPTDPRYDVMVLRVPDSTVTRYSGNAEVKPLTDNPKVPLGVTKSGDVVFYGGLHYLILYDIGRWGLRSVYCLDDRTVEDLDGGVFVTVVGRIKT